MRRALFIFIIVTIGGGGILDSFVTSSATSNLQNNNNNSNTTSDLDLLSTQQHYPDSFPTPIPSKPTHHHHHKHRTKPPSPFTTRGLAVINRCTLAVQNKNRLKLSQWSDEYLIRPLTVPRLKLVVPLMWFHFCFFPFLDQVFCQIRIRLEDFIVELGFGLKC